MNLQAEKLEVVRMVLDTDDEKVLSEIKALFTSRFEAGVTTLKFQMKNAIIKELIWLTGILITAFLLFQLLPGFLPLDINLHDTYSYENGKAMLLENGPEHFLPFLYLFDYFIVLAFWVYLTRATYTQFKINLTDTILLIFTGLFLYFFDSIITFFSILIINNHPPSQPRGLTAGMTFDRYYFSKGFYLTIHLVKLILTLLFGFTAYIIARNHRKLSHA